MITFLYLLNSMWMRMLLPATFRHSTAALDLTSYSSLMQAPNSNSRTAPLPTITSRPSGMLLMVRRYYSTSSCAMLGLPQLSRPSTGELMNWLYVIDFLNEFI
jgi:hypothetical protein